jgi:hypothetical protein
MVIQQCLIRHNIKHVIFIELTDVVRERLGQKAKRVVTFGELLINVSTFYSKFYNSLNSFY